MNSASKIFRFVRFLLHLPRFVKLAVRLFVDSRVPIHRKAILVLTELIAVMFAIVYFVFPLDFDFLPVIGKLDDLLLALFLISAPGVWLFVKLVDICSVDISLYPRIDLIMQNESVQVLSCSIWV